MARIEQRLVCAYYTPEEVEELEKASGKEIKNKFTKIFETGCTCDICNKEIKEYSVYIRVLSGHREWGNDSVDSQTLYDICSTECLDKLYQQFKDKHYKTSYFDVEFDTLRLECD